MLTSPRRATAGVRAAVATSLLLVPLAACGDTTADSPAAVGLSSPTGSTQTQTPSQSTAPDQPDASPSPSRTTPAQPGNVVPLGRSSSLAAVLLPAAELPGLNDSFRWRETATTATQPEGLGTCLEFSLVSIGAEEVGFRGYGPARRFAGERPAYAGHVVGRFPDRMTARRARAVLMSWRDGCQKRLDEAGRKGTVGPLQTVTDARGRAAWYLTTRPLKGSDAAVLEATGLVKVRNRIAVVVMRHRGQDYDYPPGEEPMVETLRRAGALLRG